MLDFDFDPNTIKKVELVGLHVKIEFNECSVLRDLDFHYDNTIYLLADFHELTKKLNLKYFTTFNGNEIWLGCNSDLLYLLK